MILTPRLTTFDKAQMILLLKICLFDGTSGYFGALMLNVGDSYASRDACWFECWSYLLWSDFVETSCNVAEIFSRDLRTLILEIENSLCSVGKYLVLDFRECENERKNRFIYF